jgi:hypothetical protein
VFVCIVGVGSLAGILFYYSICEYVIYSIAVRVCDGCTNWQFSFSSKVLRFKKGNEEKKKKKKGFLIKIFKHVKQSVCRFYNIPMSSPSNSLIL